MTDFLRAIGNGWLIGQLVVFLLVVLFTFRSFRTKESNASFIAIVSFVGLWASALITPFVALAQPDFWVFMGMNTVLWLALFIYFGALSSTVAPENPGMMALMIPMLAWLFSWPAALAVRWIF